MRGTRSVGLMVLLAAVIACEQDASPPPVAAGSDSGYGLTLGALAPPFRLPDLDGKIHGLEDLRGSVVLLNFWATWCGPCRQEIPTLVRLQKRYGGSGLRVVGVAMDRKGVPVVRPFLEEQGMRYLNLLGTPQMARSYGAIRSLPTTFLLDRQGRIVRSFVGLFNAEVLEEIVRTTVEQE